MMGGGMGGMMGSGMMGGEDEWRGMSAVEWAMGGMSARWAGRHDGRRDRWAAA